MNVAQETLGFRRAGLSPALSLLMSAFALPIPPGDLSITLHRPTERSPTACAIPSARFSARLDFESRLGLRCILRLDFENRLGLRRSPKLLCILRLDFESRFGLGRGGAPLNLARNNSARLASSKHRASNALRWIAHTPSFGYWLTAPLHLPRRTTRPVSYYAFFKGWLLLSQPPGCLSLPTSFAT